MKPVIVLFHENGQKMQRVPTRSGHPAHSESVSGICQDPAEGALLAFIDSGEQKHREGGGGAWYWSSWLLEPAPSFLGPRHFRRVNWPFALTCLNFADVFNETVYIHSV